MGELKFRFIFFISSLLILLTFEFLVSSRKRKYSRLVRWPGNFLILLFDSILMKVIFPIGAVGVAVWVQQNEIGPQLNFFWTIVVLDFFIYLQHWLSHKWSILWRFHLVHHSDPELDVSSALRFHPIEIIYSMIYKLIIIIGIGADPYGVFVFEIILNSMAMFNHSNIYLPEKFEKILRYFVVTPQMHLIHHSIKQSESDRNYGFNISLWDRIFKTYLDRFYDEISTGQNYCRKNDDQKVQSLLTQPFNKYIIDANKNNRNE